MEQKQNKENKNVRTLSEHKKQILGNLDKLKSDLVNDLDRVHKGYLDNNKYLSVENFMGADVLPKSQTTKFLLDMNQAIMEMIDSARELVINVNTNSIDELDKLEQQFYNNWEQMWTALKNGDVI